MTKDTIPLADKREIELRAFEIDAEEIKKRLQHIGARATGHMDYQRGVFDVIPATPDKWIRLRTDGTTTTLAVKERVSDAADGTREHEVKTDGFDATLDVLRTLGYEPRSIQESRRDAYDLGDVEVSIDEWPGVAPYVEIEAPSEEAIYATAESLGIPRDTLTGESIEQYYQRMRGIDLRVTSVQF